MTKRSVLILICVVLLAIFLFGVLFPPLFSTEEADGDLPEQSRLTRPVNPLA